MSQRCFILAFLAACWLVRCAGPHPCPDGPDPAVDYTGEWDSEWGRVRLQQQGYLASGTYTYIASDRPVEGQLEGVVTGRVFRFRWSERDEAGFGWFTMTEDARAFVGSWWPDGGGDADTQGWHGVRR